MTHRETTWLAETEPTHAEDLVIISRALAAADLVLLGTEAPAPEYRLTPELMEAANRAVVSIGQCRQRTFFVR